MRILVMPETEEESICSVKYPSFLPIVGGTQAFSDCEEALLELAGLALMFIPVAGIAGFLGKSAMKAYSLISKTSKIRKASSLETAPVAPREIPREFSKTLSKEEEPIPETLEIQKASSLDTTPVSYEEFAKALSKAKDSMPEKRRWRVSEHTVEEYEEIVSEGGKLLVTKEGSTFAIKADKDIISVCKKQIEGGAEKGVDIMKTAIKEGGRKLDSYMGNLDFYQKCGFELTSMTKGIKQWLPDDAKALLEKGVLKEVEDIGAFVYKGEKVNKYEDGKDFITKNPKQMFDDIENGYQNMIDYRDEIAKKFFE